jgi:competence ComEA-like helix-hairpin-helix protein
VLFTPDERRALITIGGLLTLGLCVRLLAPGSPPPGGGADSLLVVLSSGGAPADTTGSPPPPGLLEEGKVWVNEASRSDLTFLPRIGPVLADRIIEERERNGPFRTVADLARVKGIGPSTVRRLAPFVSCSLRSGSAQAGSTAIVRDAMSPISANRAPTR